MKIVEIAFTAYPVTDMPRARAFYEGVLGLTPSMVGGDDERGYWVEYEVQGQVLAIANVSKEWVPMPNGASIALEVEDFAETLTYLEEKGIPVVFGPIDSGVCDMVGIADPDGSQITLHKRKSFSTH